MEGTVPGLKQIPEGKWLVGLTLSGPGGGVGHHANGIIKKLFFWPLEHGRMLIDF